MKKGITCIAILLVVVASILLPMPIHSVNGQTQPTIFFDQTSINETQINQVFTLNINISNVQNLWGWAVNVTWDGKYINLESKKEGTFLSDQMTTEFAPTGIFNFTDEYHNADTYQGISISCSGSSSADGIIQDSASGSGVLATMTFQVVNQTQSTPITLTIENLLGPVDLPTAGHDTTGTNPSITPSSISSTTLVSLIIPGPPTANAGRDQTVPAGTQVVLNASQSVSSGNNTTYTWTFLDGTQQETSQA